ncbi:hypothetical protein OTU49_001110, partial [Cherax quadricarinatus]
HTTVVESVGVERHTTVVESVGVERHTTVVESVGVERHTTVVESTVTRQSGCDITADGGCYPAPPLSPTTPSLHYFHPRAPTMVLLTLKNLQQQTFTVEIELSATVRALKEKVEKEKGTDYPAVGQKLIYAG